MGLLKWRSGASFIDGEDIQKMGYRRLWSKVAYVPQAKNASAAYSVEEMVLLGRSSYFNFWQTPKTEDLELVEKILQELHIEHLAKKRCSEISGGELQMVLIAKALIAEPKILILDEPESNLDFRNQLIVLETMSALAAQGMICIFNTHYPTHALQRANKALLLCKGGEYTFGETKQVIHEGSINKAFGVETVIGDIETPEKILSNIVPLKLSIERNGALEQKEDINRIAVISIISSSMAQSERINEILHQYSKYFIGRMGLPYRKKGVQIINLTLDAPQSISSDLIQRLNMLEHVSVKATYEPTEVRI